MQFALHRIGFAIGVLLLCVAAGSAEGAGRAEGQTPHELASVLCRDGEQCFLWQELSDVGVPYRVYLYTSDEAPGLVVPDAFLMQPGVIAGGADTRLVLGETYGQGYRLDPVTGYAVVEVQGAGETGDLVQNWEWAQEILNAAQIMALIRDLRGTIREADDPAAEDEAIWSEIHRDREPYRWAANGADSLTPAIYNALGQNLGHDMENPPLPAETYREGLVRALRNLTTPGAATSADDDLEAIGQLLGPIQGIAASTLDVVEPGLKAGQGISSTGVSALNSVSDALGPITDVIDVVVSVVTLTQDCFDEYYKLAWQGAVAEHYKSELRELLPYLAEYGYPKLQNTVQSMIDSELNADWITLKITAMISQQVMSTGASVVVNMGVNTIMQSAASANPITVGIVAGVHAGLAVAELTGYDQIYAGNHKAMTYADFERALYLACKSLREEELLGYSPELSALRLFRFARKLQVTAAHEFYDNCVKAGEQTDRVTSDYLQDLLNSGGISESVIQWRRDRAVLRDLIGAPLPIQKAHALKLNAALRSVPRRSPAELPGQDTDWGNASVDEYRNQDLVIAADWKVGEEGELLFEPPTSGAEDVRTLTIAESGSLTLAPGAAIRFSAETNAIDKVFRIIVNGELRLQGTAEQPVLIEHPTQVVVNGVLASDYAQFAFHPVPFEGRTGLIVQPRGILNGSGTRLYNAGGNAWSNSTGIDVVLNGAVLIDQWDLDDLNEPTWGGLPAGLLLQSDTATVQGATVQGSVFCIDAAPTLEGSTVSGGVVCLSSAAKLRGNTIENDQVRGLPTWTPFPENVIGSSFGILLSNCRQARLENNTIRHCSYGIRLVESDDNTVAGNGISGPAEERGKKGIDCRRSPNNLFDNNEVSGFETGISLLRSDHNIIRTAPSERRSGTSAVISDNGCGIRIRPARLFNVDSGTLPSALDEGALPGALRTALSDHGCEVAVNTRIQPVAPNQWLLHNLAITADGSISIANSYMLWHQPWANEIQVYSGGTGCIVRGVWLANNDTGIDLECIGWQSHVTPTKIENNRITGGELGMRAYACHNLHLAGNVIRETETGVRLRASSNCNLRDGNRFEACTTNAILWDDVRESRISGNSFSANDCNNIELQNCWDCAIRDNHISGAGADSLSIGIYATSTQPPMPHPRTDSEITGNHIEECNRGIELRPANGPGFDDLSRALNCAVTGNLLTANQHGLSASSGTGPLGIRVRENEFGNHSGTAATIGGYDALELSDNIFTGNSAGLTIEDVAAPAPATIADNLFMGNTGLAMEAKSSNVAVFGNTFASASGAGVRASGTADNRVSFRHNVFKTAQNLEAAGAPVLLCQHNYWNDVVCEGDPSDITANVGPTNAIHPYEHPYGWLGDVPQAAFTLDPVSPEPGETITFHGAVDDPDSDAFTSEWDFGDGTRIEGDINPEHAYDAPGVYTVSFTARDRTELPDGTTGLADSATRRVVIPVRRHTVTATASQAEGTEIRFLTRPVEWSGDGQDQPLYEGGTEITVLALVVGDVPIQFDHWEDTEGNLLSEDREWSFTVTADRTIKAVYVERQFRVDTAVYPNPAMGTITQTPSPSANGTYPPGTSVSLSAEPAEHYRFVQWGGDSVGTDNPVSLAVSRHKSVTAQFAALDYELTLQVSHGDRGSAVLRSPQGGETVQPYGTPMAVHAEAAPGYILNKWIDGNGALLSRQNPFEFTLDTDRTVETVFDTIDYRIAVSCVPQAGGNYSRNWWDTPGEETVTAHPAPGYEFTHWSDSEGGIYSRDKSFVITVEEGMDISFTAHFRPLIYQVGMTALPAGKVRVQGRLFTLPDPDEAMGGALRGEALPQELAEALEQRWFEVPAEYAIKADQITGAPGEGYLLLRDGEDPVYRFVVGDEQLIVYAVPSEKYEGGFPCPYNQEVTLETYHIADGYIADSIENLRTGWRARYGEVLDPEEPYSVHVFTVKGDENFRVRYKPRPYLIRVINNYKDTTALEFDPEPEQILDEEDGLPVGMTVYQWYGHGQPVTIRVHDTTEMTRFSGWTGDIESTDNPLEFTITDETNLTVNVDWVRYTLELEADPPEWGTAVVVEPNKASYAPGEEVTVNASTLDPTLCRFAGWDGGLTADTGWQTLVMDGDKHLVAHFERKRYALRLVPEPVDAGTVTLSPMPGADGRYPAGETVTVSAEPAPGWAYRGIWDNDGITPHLDESSFEVTLDHNKGGTVRFQDARPPTIRDLTVDAASYSATVHFTTDEVADALVFLDTDPEMDTDHFDAHQDTYTLEHHIKVDSDSLVSLQPGTTYYGKIRAIDEAGLISWSDVFSFTPPPDTTPPVVMVDEPRTDAMLSGGRSADPVRIRLLANEAVEFRYATEADVPFAEMTNVSRMLSTDEDTLELDNCRDGETVTVYVKAQDRADIVSPKDAVVRFTLCADKWWAGTQPENPWDWLDETEGMRIDDGRIALAPPAPKPVRSRTGALLRPIRITNSLDQALTDFPVRVDVSYDEDMESDFGDLRFAGEDGTPLSFWIQLVDAGVAATVWLRIPQLPAGNSTVWMSYGDPDAPGGSNGGETFLFFEDFETGAFDAWSFEKSTNGDRTGSVQAGTWQTSMATDTPLSGGSSARIIADSNASAPPWNVQAAMTRTLVGANGALALDADMRFDDAPDGKGGNGSAYVLIRVENQDNTQAISYGFTKHGDVGTYREQVADGEKRIPYSAAFSRDFADKNQTPLSDEYKVSFQCRSDMAEYNPPGDQRRRSVTTIDNVRIRPVADPEPTAIVGAEQGGDAATGSFTTRPVTPNPRAGIAGWAVFTADHSLPLGAWIEYDLLSAADRAVLATVTAAEAKAGTDVSESLEGAASVAIRARMGTEDETALPAVDSLRLSWRNYQPPEPAFTISAGPFIEPVTGEPVSLDAAGSDDPDDDIVRFSWRIEQPDGSWGEASGEQVDANWTESGTFVVELTVEDARELRSTLERRINVAPRPPVAAFEAAPTEATVDQLVNLDPAASTHPAGEITVYAWQFGDGTRLTTDSPSVVTHGYAKPGQYAVRLWVADELGATGMASQSVTVRPQGEPDNLPDAWELRYFGNLSELDDGDPDADGLSNLEEYQQGTDPSGRSWQMSLRVEHADRHQDLRFGMDWTATSGVDAGLDEPTEPGGDGQGAAGLVAPDGNGLRVDLRAVADTGEWLLVVSAATDGPTTLSWNPLLVPKGGLSLIELDANGEMLNNAVNFDLGGAKIVTVEIPAGQTRRFALVFGEVLFQLVLQDEWNLVALPVQPQNPDLGAIFASFEIETAWLWQSGANSYVSTRTLEPGKGYWIWLDLPSERSTATVTVRGSVPMVTTADFAAGWHLFGVQCPPPYATLSAALIAEPTDALSDTCWYWSNKQYHRERDSLLPGVGYWNFAGAACTVLLEPVRDFVEVTPAQLQEAVDKLILTVVDVRSADAYAAEHIPGALSRPLSEMQEGTADLSFNKHNPVLVYGQSGVQSRSAAEILLDAGFRTVANLAGGLTAWRGDGLPVTQAELE